MSANKEDTKEDLEGHKDQTQDAVFGEITEEGPNYRSVGFMGTVILMMKTQIGLGLLSVPGAFNQLGLVPGIICLLAVATITTWSTYVIGKFKINHREVYSIDDAGQLVFGPVGRGVLSVGFCLYWIFVTGSSILGVSIGLNTVSTHGVCTAVFVATAAVVGFGCCSVRTLGGITWLAWVGLPSILVSVLIVIVAVGVQDRPPTAPQTGPWSSDYKIAGSPSFSSAASAVSTLLFSLSGTPGFFSVISEMRNPKDYTRALLICQTFVTLLFAVIGIVVYYYCGSFVASPALGSAGGLMKKICYGIALPGLIVTMTIVSHIPSKYIFIHLMRGSHHLTSNSPTHWLVWLSCTLGVTVVAYIIASSIPVFDGLVSLIGAFLGPLMCIQTYGAMWLYDNWNSRENSRWWWPMACWNVFVIASGIFLMAAGTYGSVLQIMAAYTESGGSRPFSCADNSNSV